MTTNMSVSRHSGKNDIVKQRAIEWYKCRQNPLYWIYNYVYLEELGGAIKLTPDNLHPKMKRVVRSTIIYHRAVLMASRQLGKSSIAACLISWASVFFPRNKAIILNMKRQAGLKNLASIKYIIEQLPDWMVTKKRFKSKSDIKTYLELFNDSRIDVMYPSTVHSSNTLARSLTAPILYIDESAFIKDMEDIYGAAQPVLQKATQQAKKHKYPYFTLITSTPNGVYGHGKWFYERWSYAVNSDELFEFDPNRNVEIWNSKINVQDYLLNPSCNSFIKVKYHWSEDPTKDQKWYDAQCQDLNDQRRINQELDLVFVGSSDCIFTDKMLNEFRSKPAIDEIETLANGKINVFTEDLDPTDYYLIGCDTAESLTGAYCAIECFSFRDFNQIFEMQARFGSYIDFAKAIDQAFQWLYKRIGSNIILCVENNTIGKAPIENLRLNAEILKDKTFDYEPFLYTEKLASKNDEEYGIKTTGLSKQHMVGCLMQALNENVHGVVSQSLIEQFSCIERTASGTIKATGYSDLFMASCFCALVRSKKSVEIMPLIDQNQGSKTLNEDLMSLVSLNDSKKINKESQPTGDMFGYGTNPVDEAESIVINDVEEENDGVFFGIFGS